MDEVDLASELMELETELQRRSLARQLNAAPVYQRCRDCDEPLESALLRSAGFCDRYCRDRYELAERLKKINGGA
jgi:hypothetical protein